MLIRLFGSEGTAQENSLRTIEKFARNYAFWIRKNGKELQRDLSEISGRNSSVRNTEIPKIFVGVTFDCVPLRATTDVNLTRGGEAQIFHKSGHHLKIIGAEGLHYIAEVPYERSINTYLAAPCTINPLNPELNPMCCLLALLGAHHFLHVSRIRVTSLTFRQLMSYIYGAPILDVSRSHTTTQHSR